MRRAADTAAPELTWAEIGRGVVATLTMIAAVGGLFLGIRGELRADEEHQRVTEESRKGFAEQIDFYRNPSAVVVMNGSSHPVNMRLSLPHKRLSWDLYAVPPCKQITVSNRSLRGSMRAQFPSAQFTDGELSSLWLEFRDPRGRSWIRTSGAALDPSEWKPGAGKAGMVQLDEPWIRGAADSPTCGAS